MKERIDNIRDHFGILVRGRLDTHSKKKACRRTSARHQEVQHFPSTTDSPSDFSSFPKGLMSQIRAAMTKPEQNKYSESSISQKEKRTTVRVRT